MNYFIWTWGIPMWFSLTHPCPELNLITDKIPFLGLDIVERRSSFDTISRPTLLFKHLRSLVRTWGITVALYSLHTLYFCWLLFLDKINSLSPTGSNYQIDTIRRFSLHYPGSIQSTPTRRWGGYSSLLFLFSYSFFRTLSANSGANKDTYWSKQIAMMQLLRARAIKSRVQSYILTSCRDKMDPK